MSEPELGTQQVDNTGGTYQRASPETVSEARGRGAPRSKRGTILGIRVSVSVEMGGFLDRLQRKTCHI